MKSKHIFQLLSAGFLSLAFSAGQVNASHSHHDSGVPVSSFVHAPERQVLDMRGTISIDTYTSADGTVHNACTVPACTSCVPSTSPIIAVDQFRLRGHGFSIGAQTFVAVPTAATLNNSGIPVDAAQTFIQSTQILFDHPFDLPPSIVLGLENDNEAVFLDNNALLVSFTLRVSDVTTTGFTIVVVIVGVGANDGEIYKLLGTRYCGPNANINFIAEAPRRSCH